MLRTRLLPALLLLLAFSPAPAAAGPVVVCEPLPQGGELCHASGAPCAWSTHPDVAGRHVAQTLCTSLTFTREGHVIACAATGAEVDARGAFQVTCALAQDRGDAACVQAWGDARGPAWGTSETCVPLTP